MVEVERARERRKWVRVRGGILDDNDEEWCGRDREREEGRYWMTPERCLDVLVLWLYGSQHDHIGARVPGRQTPYVTRVLYLSKNVARPRNRVVPKG